MENEVGKYEKRWEQIKNLWFSSPNGANGTPDRMLLLWDFQKISQDADKEIRMLREALDTLQEELREEGEWPTYTSY